MNSENFTGEIDNENLYAPCVLPLSRGILKVFEPCLEKCRLHLNELNSKHNMIEKQIEDENREIMKLCQNTVLQDLFRTISVCQNKLVVIKKDMKMLYEKSSKLKKQAVKLQQISRSRSNI